MMKLPEIIVINSTVKLEKICAEHCESLFFQIDTHREYLSNYVDWTKYNTGIEDSLAFFRDCEKESEQGISYVWVICVEGNAVGTISFNKPIDWKKRVVSIGYWLSPSYQGKGIVTQAVDFLIKNTKVYFNRYILKCALHNEKSNAVAKRCGFELVEVLPQAEKIGEALFDQNRYEKRISA